MHLLGGSVVPEEEGVSVLVSRNFSRKPEQQQPSLTDRQVEMNKAASEVEV